MCCGSVLSMVLRILFLPLIPLAHWFQNPGDVATLHALRPLLFCFIFYSMGIEQRKPWILKKSRVGHLGVPSHLSGLLIFRGKKRKISRDFQGQIRGKIGRLRRIFAGKSQNSRKNPPISREKSQNSQENRPISRHFSGKSQISKDFQGQIHRKIGRFHGETAPRNHQ